MKTLKAIRDALVLKWENRRVEYMTWVSTGAAGAEVKEARALELEACIKDLEACIEQSASSLSVDSRTPAVSSTDGLAELEAEYRQLQSESEEARREGLGNLADKLETRMEYIDMEIAAKRRCSG